MEDIRHMYTGGQDPDAFFEPSDMMNYTGKLYGNIGNNSYFYTGKTGKDWDKLEERLSIEERQNEMLIQELHNKDKEIEHLREEAKISEYNNLFALFKKGYVLALPINSCVDVNELRVKFDEICTELAFNFK